MHRDALREEDGLWPEQKALAYRILKLMELRESTNHPGVPLVSYGHIGSLADDLNISNSDIRFLKSIEYLTPEQRVKINEFVANKRNEMDALVNGWEYDISRVDGVPVISIRDRDGKKILSITDGGLLEDWSLDPDFDPDDDSDIPYEGRDLYLEHPSLASSGIYLNPIPYEASFSILLDTFMRHYNYARMKGWEEELVEGTGGVEVMGPFWKMIGMDIDEIFNFGDSPSVDLVRERLKLAKQAIDDSYSGLGSFVGKFTRYLNRRDAIQADDSEITEFVQELLRDAEIYDVLVGQIEEANDAAIGIANNIIPDLVDVFKADSILDISRLLNPGELPGAWEHEVGHIILGMGATRHGDFASNYGIWMMHGYSPAGWLLTNYFNRLQQAQFRAIRIPNSDGTVPDDDAELVPHMEIPLWMDIPPELFGYPDNPRAVHVLGQMSGSKSSTAYTNGRNTQTRITPNEYVESMPISGKAWLFPDGTILPVTEHADLSNVRGRLGDAQYRKFFGDVSDAGLVRIDMGYTYTNSPRGKAISISQFNQSAIPYSLIVDIGYGRPTAMQISAIRNLLVRSGVPFMFLSVGGINPAVNFQGIEYKFTTGVDNLSRLVAEAFAGLPEAQKISYSESNHPGPLARWRKKR